MNQHPSRFITADNMVVEELPWGRHEWLCRPEIADAENLLLVRVHMPPGQAHKFHRHPEMEEVIYIEQGIAQQWVDRDKRILRQGESAHIPMNMVHGTYNAGDETLVFLAILSPAKIEGPPLVDMYGEQPWKSLR